MCDNCRDDSRHCIGCDHTYAGSHFHTQRSRFCKDCVGPYYSDAIIRGWWDEFSLETQGKMWKLLKEERAAAGVPAAVTHYMVANRENSERAIDNASGRAILGLIKGAVYELVARVRELSPLPRSRRKSDP